MRNFRFERFLFIALFFPLSTYASDKLLDEIPGIVVDQTITVSGHRFAEAFSMHRSFYFPQAQAGLVIKERPSARRGNLIWVEWQHKRLVQTLVFPSSKTEATALQLLNQAQQEIKKHKIQQLLLGRDIQQQDLAQDEW